jgi:hypothetical protein
LVALLDMSILSYSINIVKYIDSPNCPASPAVGAANENQQPGRLGRAADRFGA